MKMVKSLLLGSAAGLVAMAGAQAADMPVKAKPVQYVKICSLYGAGFYYIPGTDTCLKVGGFLRVEANFNANGSFNPFRVQNFDSTAKNREVTRVRGGISLDARSQTEYGTLRSYMLMAPTDTNGPVNGGSPYVNGPIFVPAMFIQLAGFTAGKTASFFDFDSQPYSNITATWGPAQGGNGIAVLAYTAQFGNGFSASISAEDTTVRRTAIAGNLLAGGAAAAAGYGGRRWPDIVGNLRIDQAWGSAQIAGAIHDVYAVSATAVAAATNSQTGSAIGAGLKINLPMLGKGDYVIGGVEWANGAINYLGSNFGAGGAATTELLQNGFPAVTASAIGPGFDCVGIIAGTSCDMTKGWSFTAGLEHNWDAKWKSSLYGGYGKLQYSAAASAAILNGAAGFGGLGSAVAAGPSANWSLWQLGSRTVFTPVQNLDLSVDVVYTKLQTAFGGTVSGVAALGTFQDKGFWAGIVRAQRNFWP